MNFSKKLNRRCVTIVGLAPLFLQMASANPFVNFTRSLNTAKDPDVTYDNFSNTEAGISSSYVIGFQIALNSINGCNVNLSPIAALGSAMEEDISVAIYTFKAKDLSTLAVHQSGATGTASSSIPVGGIGQQRVGYVNKLFDQCYISKARSEWTYTSAHPVSHAFQLALWGLTHDNEFSMTNTNGAVYIGSQTAGTGAAKIQPTKALVFAQATLNNVSSAKVSSSYISTKFSIWALVDIDGGVGGWQDVVLASKNGSLNDTGIEPLLPPSTIPEPITQTLIMVSGATLFFINRIFRRNGRRYFLK